MWFHPTPCRCRHHRASAPTGSHIGTGEKRFNVLSGTQSELCHCNSVANLWSCHSEGGHRVILHHGAKASLTRIGMGGLKEVGPLGPKTGAAITAFQEGNRLTPADGVVRPATIAALVAAGADQPPVWALGGLS